MVIYRKSNWFVGGLLLVGAFLLYWPILGRTFSSDDFLVMRRVGLEKVIFIPDFFRPLSDVLLYFNYLLGGFSPVGYYVFSVVLHALCAFLLFRFCWLWKWADGEDRQWRFAFFAALLFLCYPFHNESVVWVLGRGSLVAALLAMGGLVSVVNDGPLWRRILCCCLCYFVGMAGYESVLLLPVMVAVLLFVRGAGRRELIYWMVAMGVTLAANIICRVLVSGGVSGGYGLMFVKQAFLRYGGNLFKLAGRLFLPPMNDSRVMTGMFLLLVLVLGLVVRRFWRAGDKGRRRYFLGWVLMLVVSGFIPLLVGVSSHTSESDRMLYLPSLFVCGLGALLLVAMDGRPGFLLGLLLGYGCIFLELNNRNWLKASQQVREVLAVAEAPKPGGRVFVVNVPDEVDGAFVFRLGLKDALVMDGKDSSKLVVVGHLTRDSSRLLPDSIGVEGRWGAGRMEGRIAPATSLERLGGDSCKIIGADGEWVAVGADRIFYWNKRRMVEWRW